MPAMPASVLRFFTASHAADAEAWASAFAEDALFHDPVGQPPIEGREAIHAFFADVLSGFSPFLGLTPLQAHTAGDAVAVAWHGSALTTAGRPVSWSGINVFELDGQGLISEARAYFDQAVLRAQLTS
ncbi:nuclear transport factor 2 family protein [Streptomyces sp. NBC_01803]|uniref:nuclear transport factor 2 family protein n=1 Tax=Streptomyces sp. NBC_01803 TaxID=2975946 RepID=UPI002DD84BC3|nr:SgcJ/EcaC family oxidoreductase [Streptomyces sp. NBC_01803]WSA47591.1 SgcJ/EcaC family oxidoreductase [Streptomyces sp. NBC_01803]